MTFTLIYLAIGVALAFAKGLPLRIGMTCLGDVKCSVCVAARYMIFWPLWFLEGKRDD